ncbi:T-cell surface glycoprotein CD1b-3-like isoform X3 [Meleagris gallopavo]|uniref:T-cell surface glycoprotein CD1b-3-like isoform X3 n=1 Tax=Meleagris gallopavo TaxID=9103 RepID=UPI00093DDD09|nr:T-cell surface glycoprotein CD1b-3-like isoform X3 [Meleagris gallopavo]
MGQKESFQIHSLNTSAQLPAEGISGTSPKPKHRAYWLLWPPSATSKARADLRSERPLHPAASVWSCAADTMQPHAILLLFFFFPGTWAEPEDPFVFQTSVGCELYSNETIRTFFDIAYNGQIFLRFRLDTGTWDQMQHNQLAAIAEHLMVNASTLNEVIQVLLGDTCVEVLRIFIQAGKADLERQVPPIAVVFARTAGPAQLLLVCRVTSFYPRPITVTWLRDGKELPPSPALSTGTVLPNADLTYQLRSTLAGCPPGDGHSYACRVQHRSLGDRSLLVPWDDSKRGLSAGLGAVLLLAAAAVAAVLVWRYRKRQRSDGERGVPLEEHRSTAQDGTAAGQYGGCDQGTPGEGRGHI